MSWTASLAHGLAEHVAAAGIATYRPTGTYTAEETGLVIGTMPAAPPRVVVLAAYALADDIDQADSRIGLQGYAAPAPVRATPWTCSTPSSTSCTAPPTLTSPSCWCTSFERTSSAPMGRDENGHYEHADTYHLTAHRPTRHCL